MSEASSSSCYLEQSGEDVELEHGDVVVAGEVYGGLERHGLQAGADGMELVEGLAEHLPRNYGPGKRTRDKAAM